MHRRFISCLLLVAFAFQSVNAASLGVGADIGSDVGMSVHCDHMSHDTANASNGNSQTNDCCTDECVIQNGCAAHCVVFGIAPSMAIKVTYLPGRQAQLFVQSDTVSPSYIPLNPPPII
jgi:hypothetical protein